MAKNKLRMGTEDSCEILRLVVLQQRSPLVKKAARVEIGSESEDGDEEGKQTKSSSFTYRKIVFSRLVGLTASLMACFVYKKLLRTTTS